MQKRIFKGIIQPKNDSLLTLNIVNLCDFFLTKEINIFLSAVSYPVSFVCAYRFKYDALRCLMSHEQLSCTVFDCLSANEI